MAVYRFKPRLHSEWVLEKQSGEILPMGDVLRLLAAVDEHGHIAGACQARGVSYRHAWGILRKAEAEFQAPLIETSRRRGSRLTSFAQHLLWANRRIDARLAPTFESLASELQEELQRLYSEEMSVLRLHASHGFAVEGLMRLANGQDMLPLELRYRTGIEALASLDRGECDLAGFQVPVAEYEKPILQRYMRWLDPDRMLLLHLAERNTGLFVQPGNPKHILSASDLVRPETKPWTPSGPMPTQPRMTPTRWCGTSWPGTPAARAPCCRSCTMCRTPWAGFPNRPCRRSPPPCSGPAPRSMA